MAGEAYLPEVRGVNLFNSWGKRRKSKVLRKQRGSGCSVSAAVLFFTWQGESSPLMARPGFGVLSARPQLGGFALFFSGHTLKSQKSPRWQAFLLPFPRGT